MSENEIPDGKKTFRIRFVKGMIKAFHIGPTELSDF